MCYPIVVPSFPPIRRVIILAMALLTRRVQPLLIGKVENQQIFIPSDARNVFYNTAHLKVVTTGITPIMAIIVYRFA